MLEPFGLGRLSVGIEPPSRLALEGWAKGCLVLSIFVVVQLRIPEEWLLQVGGRYSDDRANALCRLATVQRFAWKII